MEQETDWTLYRTLVIKKLVQIYCDKNVESILRVLFYLDNEESQCGESQQQEGNSQAGSITSPPPAEWKILRSCVESSDNNMFQLYAECLIEDTKTPEKNDKFHEKLNLVYWELIETTENPLPAEDDDNSTEGFDLVQLDAFDMSWVLIFPGLAETWSLIATRTKSEILYAIPEIISKKSKVVALPNKTFPIHPLASILLPSPVQKDLNRWWAGDIEGRRCAMNIVSFTCTRTAELTGLVQGGVMGYSSAGVIGAVAGGFFLGTISALAVHILINKLMESLLGVPAQEGLENAYKFLGVSPSATNLEINSIYRRLCLKHHPDKGGEPEYFVLLQVHMGVIKAARGDM